MNNGIETKENVMNSEIEIIGVEMPTSYGEFKLYGFSNGEDEYRPNLVLIKGDDFEGKVPLVRIHSECLTGDIFSSQRCDCGDQLKHAIKLIEKEGEGVVVYLRQEGRGIGLFEKLKAYKLQEKGYDTVDANLMLGHESDSRDYGFAAELLKYFGISKIRLITNNTLKVDGIKKYGIEVKERIPSIMPVNEFNIKYMNTKKSRMNHIL